jgi:hypothetical protein
MNKSLNHLGSAAWRFLVQLNELAQQSAAAHTAGWIRRRPSPFSLHHARSVLEVKRERTGMLACHCGVIDTTRKDPAVDQELGVARIPGIRGVDELLKAVRTTYDG